MRLESNIAFTKTVGLALDFDARGVKLSDFQQNPEDRDIYVEELIKNGFVEDLEIKAKAMGVIIAILTSARLIHHKHRKPID